MPIPAAFRGQFTVPALAAPMFLVSGPELVIAACCNGIGGTFPALNARPASQFDEWLGRIETALAARRATHPRTPVAPYGVNLIVHPSNGRMAEDLDIIVRHRVPLVISSLGHPGPVVEAVHGYGGLVFADVIHAHHARRAAEAGVDGIIAIAAGAGGHAGTQSAFSLVQEVRAFWSGCLVLGGAISDGAGIRAAEILGADLAYLGTRFIATREAAASEGYKAMIVASGARDVVYTDAVSGTPANFLWPSLEQAGYTRDALRASEGKAHLKSIADEAKAWRDTWSAGHGVAVIDDVPTVDALAKRLAEEYRAACAHGISAAVVA
ncbi:MAG: nitronate monooxygenase family protein [Rhodocyclaceae bacterium]